MSRPQLENSVYTLIQICSSHNALASILGHYYSPVAQVINRGGMYRNTVLIFFLRRASPPIENSKDAARTRALENDFKECAYKGKIFGAATLRKF